MKPDENATEADNTQASDPELVDEDHLVDSPQEAETAVPECEQIDVEAEEIQEQPESWHTFKTP